MGEIIAGSEVKSAELVIKVIRADGTEEDLGVVARYDRNKLKQAIQRLKDWIKNTYSKLNKWVKSKI